MSTGALTFDVRPYGERAVLLDLPDSGTRRAVTRWLVEHDHEGVESVPAERTILLQVGDRRVGAAGAHERLTAVLRDLREADPGDHERSEHESPVVDLDVVYDGPDLADAAEALGMSVEGLVRWHTESAWEVEFLGFMPGFGYLTRPGDTLEVPRRSSPRTRIPVGSVGLAGRYSGVYPSASPGGWQLIGTTSAVMFDPGGDGALLTPGDRVQFRVSEGTERGRG
ncbi:allophanate hydrolase subunit 1 [Flexivirga sp. ID2601S]|uniref:Allophanate hydrolase subunit 1 n=1 Tax=Flexivirga aerilata TaxID=1656889 RepID=A0A849AEY9_9MICO|nr:allophanate hydrolase subunit 1 [Flexivirga aerilata]NNG39055.1 allophanate hydrolase subunit 1 [Flexivirga aerilata]